jgi:hypothetical protein
MIESNENNQIFFLQQASNCWTVNEYSIRLFVEHYNIMHFRILSSMISCLNAYQGNIFSITRENVEGATWTLTLAFIEQTTVIFVFVDRDLCFNDHH